MLNITMSSTAMENTSHHNSEHTTENRQCRKRKQWGCDEWLSEIGNYKRKENDLDTNTIPININHLPIDHTNVTWSPPSMCPRQQNSTNNNLSQTVPPNALTVLPTNMHTTDINSMSPRLKLSACPSLPTTYHQHQQYVTMLKTEPPMKNTKSNRFRFHF